MKRAREIKSPVIGTCPTCKQGITREILYAAAEEICKQKIQEIDAEYEESLAKLIPEMVQ